MCAQKAFINFQVVVGYVLFGKRRKTLSLSTLNIAKMGGMQIVIDDVQGLDGGPPMPLRDVIIANHRMVNMYMLTLLTT